MYKVSFTRYKIRLTKMIIEQNTEFKAIRLLVKYWYRSFSAYEIVKEAKISAPRVYDVVKKLESKGVIIRNEKKVRLNFNNLFAYTTKLMYDSERLLDLSEEEQMKINQVFSVLKKEYDTNLLAFMIFGSVASGEQTKKSDIDLLAIVKEKKEIDYKKRGLLNLGSLNIIEKKESEFENDYLMANDLVLNVLINGIIISDNGIIRFLLNKPLPMPSNEVIMQKKERLDVLKERLFALLKEKNYEELVEQLKLFIIERGRILLLQKNIIPSSKKNIIDNLKKIDKQLYRDYTTLNERNVKDILEKNV